MLHSILLLPLFSYGVHLLPFVLFVVLPSLVVFYVVLAALPALVVLGEGGRLGAVCIQAFGRDRDEKMHSPFLRLPY